MRERAGLSMQDAADMLGINRTHVTNVELAKYGISDSRVRMLAVAYRCGDTAYVEALAAIAREPSERTNQWWEKFREDLPAGVLDLAELEHHAVGMRTFQGAHTPGLLQTEDYARAVMSLATPPRTPLQLELHVHLRMLRQRVLDRDAPPTYTSLVHEAALRMQFGGRKVLKAQLKRLLEASERENVTLLVVPFDAGGVPGAGTSCLYVEGPVPQLDTVQFDTPYEALYLDAETHLANYRRSLDRVHAMALPEAKSRDFIRTVAQEL
jgi:transcriptional regulator with XRE-family HTH domain